MTFSFDRKADADKFEKQLRKQFILSVRKSAREVELYNVQSLKDSERVIAHAKHIFSNVQQAGGK